MRSMVKWLLPVALIGPNRQPRGSALKHYRVGRAK